MEQNILGLLEREVNSTLTVLNSMKVEQVRARTREVGHIR